MLSIFFFLPLLVVHGAEVSLSEFQKENENTVDHSSIKVCWLYGASKVAVVDGDPQLGHKCTVHLDNWTEDKKQAKEFCESRLPYYIIDAEPNKNDGGTICTFQINLHCDPAYVQIHGRCYKVLIDKNNLAVSKKLCEARQGASPGKLAHYYTIHLNLYFDQMDGIDDAWVRVTNMNEFYDNGSGDNGVYIQDSGYEYDVRPGTILMDSEESLHQAICEYTPPMTRAEMFYLAKIYSEIYPFEIYNGGAIIPTSSFMTIEQTDFNAGQNIAHFSPEELDPVCLSIGKILNVESYPMTAIEEEYKGVKDRLTRHRFYLTNAYKDDGCFKADYRQWNNKKQSFQLYKSGNYKDNGYCEAHSFCFNEQDRYPTMAAMRAPLLCALHTFNQEYANCPSPPDWSEPPVRFTRKDRVFCHYINNKMIATRDEAKQHCQKIDAALTGFDSVEEFEAVNKNVKPEYPPGSEQHFSTYPEKYWGPRKNGIQVDDHYNLGAQSPCQNACDDVKNGAKHVASWDFGVAANNDFLNYMNHTGIAWTSRGQRSVSFRADYVVFHLHSTNQYRRMFFICGRSADLKPAERQTGQLSGN